MFVRVWCASFLFALPRRSRQPPATVRSPALYDDQVLARCRGLSCIRNCFQFHSASVKGYTVICPMPSDVCGFCQPCTRARTVLQLATPGLMPLLPLPSSIIVESLLPWLHAGSVFRLATTARFDDPLLATFTSQARTALQELAHRLRRCSTHWHERACLRTSTRASAHSGPICPRTGYNS